MWTWLKLATSNIGKFLLPFIQSFFSAMGPVVAASAVARARYPLFRYLFLTFYHRHSVAYANSFHFYVPVLSLARIERA